MAAVESASRQNVISLEGLAYHFNKDYYFIYTLGTEMGICHVMQTI